MKIKIYNNKYTKYNGDVQWVSENVHDSYISFTVHVIFLKIYLKY